MDDPPRDRVKGGSEAPSLDDSPAAGGPPPSALSRGRRVGVAVLLAGTGVAAAVLCVIAVPFCATWFELDPTSPAPMAIGLHGLGSLVGGAGAAVLLAIGLWTAGGVLADKPWAPRAAIAACVVYAIAGMLVPATVVAWLLIGPRGDGRTTPRSTRAPPSTPW